MTAYTYLARDRNGRKVRGNIEAENERAAFSQLRPRGLAVISLKEKAAGFNRSGKRTGKKNSLFSWVKARDIIILFRQFSTLINAGLPIIQALTILVSQTENQALQETLTQIKDDISAGSSLSEAFSKHPRRFSPLIVNMVKAGEMGGVLDITLNRLASYLEYSEDVRTKVKAAMRYPLFVLLMAGGITGALFFFVLPQMKVMFEESLGGQLPALTQFMLDISDFLKTRFYVPLLILIGVAGLYFLFKRSGQGSYLLDSLKMKIPVLGKLFHKIALSRFARTLATLSNSGVPILDALEMTGKASGSEVVRRATLEARESLKEGETISEPLKKCPVFPPLATSMISVGEETGSLDEMLNRVADFYDQEVQTMVDSLASLIEPLLIAFLGATVGIVVIAMYLPYFEMFKYM